MDNILYIGIDATMNSTSITYLYENNIFSTLITASGITKLSPNNNIRLKNIKKKYSSNEKRFDIITDIIINDIKKTSLLFKECGGFYIGLEGYSFRSKGMVFTIGEFIGLLKQKMFKNNISFILIPPTEWKMHFGKGNANKTDLLQTLLKRKDDIANNYKINLEMFFEKHDRYKELNRIKDCDTPLSDLIDSFFIANYIKEVNNDKAG